MLRSSVLSAVVLTAALALAPAAVRAQVDSLPYVTSITTIPQYPCDSIPTKIVIAGQFPTQCGAVLGNDGYTVYLSDPLPPCAGCLEGPKPWADTLEVGMLAAGQHLFRIGVGIVDICSGSEPPDTTRYTTRFGISVGTICPPESLPDPLRYVHRVLIAPVNKPFNSFICEGDSILVRVAGLFPNGCYQVRRMDLVPALGRPSPDDVPMPPGLAVRLVFDNLCCALRYCPPEPTPFDTFIVIPPLYRGPQDLTLVGYETCCRDEPISSDPYGVQHHGFYVVDAESCGVLPPPYQCMVAGWAHDPNGGRCDAFLGKTSGPAVVTGTVGSTVALAGIQGEVHSYDSSGNWPLFVSAIEPVGPAAGMHLTWEPIPGGAKFVLWADAGAPIPPSIGIPPSQFLNVSWMMAARDTRESGITPDSLRWYVSWHDVFGSDINGRLVPLCPTVGTGFAAELAIICSGDGLCDANNDLHSDVRDLVIMSHCLSNPGTRNCPWDPATTFDCDGDHDFDFDDLFCCSRHVLGIPPCPTCDDSVRVEPGIAVSFGTPQRNGNGYDIPLRIDGIGAIGAARFTISMPPGLADLAILEGRTPEWMKVTRVVDGRLEVGLIQIPSQSLGQSPDYFSTLLRIPLPPDANPTGQIAITGSDLSGRDGVKLKADLGSPMVRLGPGVDINLSAARPNPFGTSTMFRLTLDAPADADLAIYDLSGRRISTLHKGALPIGSHPFIWNGQVEGGGRARAGVYFVRASVGGKVTKQKLVMLKE